jgi:glycosyltransferase involved in cell wall biosynthesis
VRSPDRRTKPQIFSPAGEAAEDFKSCAARQERTIQVLHVIIGLEVGGAERVLARVVAGAEDGGRVQHSVVSLTTIGTIGEQLHAAGVDVVALGTRSAAGAASAVIQLRRIIRGRRPDIVQTWMYHADLIGGLAARAAGVSRVIWGIRATSMLTGTARMTAAIRRVCAPLSRVIPEVIVCAAEASLVEHARMGYDRRRMRVIPNGFDPTRFDVPPGMRTSIRHAFGWTEGDLVVGTVGRFNPYKDYPTLVRAASLIAREEPRARFLLVGRGLHDGNAELVHLISATGYRDRFVLAGERSKTAECLAAMDVFCLSSRSEGFPNAVGEAMAAAVPCVVTDVGDAARLVGETGRVVGPGDAPALASATLDYLRMDAATRTAVGLRARRRIEDHFSAGAMQRSYVRLYEELVARSPVPTAA